MKKVILILIYLVIISNIYAQKDPALAGTVATMSSLEQRELKNIKENQNKIAAFQTSISANLKTIRYYEEKTYNYLYEASYIVRDAYEIKEAAVITSDIIKEIEGLVKAAYKHPQGVAVAAIARRQGNRATEEIIGIYSYVAGLALNKNTLLNSLERQQVLWTVLYKLRRIRSDIQLLRFQIENFTISYLPEILFPMEYFYAVDGKRIADKIINDMKKF